jgi:glycosyltransferase involved in cell wall biosynthesis
VVTDVLEVTDLARSALGERAGLRIVYVLSRFPQVSETFILREMQALEDRGHRVSVAAMVLDRSPVRQAGADDYVQRMIRPHRVRDVLAAQLHWCRRDPGAYLRVWRDALWGNRSSARFLIRAIGVVPLAATMAREIEVEDIDRLHAHYASHSLLCAWAIWRLTGIPYGVTCHAHDLYVDRSMLAEKLAEASLVVTISEFNRRLITEVCGPRTGARTEVIHCGVDTDRFGPPTEPDPDRDRPFRFVLIGSMQPYKGHHVALEAFARLGATPPVELVLIGDGGLRPELERRAHELGIAGSTRFAGAMASDEVLEELRRADCVVQPSVVTGTGKMEGIPVALMEALAVGRPVIASDLSGVSELVRNADTGVLVPPGDPVALAAAMTAAVDRPDEHRAMAERGRQLVRSEFDLAHQTDHLSALFLRHTPERTHP